MVGKVNKKAPRIATMSQENPLPQEALIEADRTRNNFSGYRDALGASGIREEKGPDKLGGAGDTISLTPGTGGFSDIYIGCAWNRQIQDNTSFLGKLLGLKKSLPIDIDLGCMFELENGETYALQALGEENGSLEQPPYIFLSHDERTGAAEGDDEFIRVNGRQWNQIRRILVYAYIYAGNMDWSTIRPHVTLNVTDQTPVRITPTLSNPDLAVCALALIENVRGGIKITNLTEYFPGQAELDRAYGFGLEWTEGQKDER